MATPTPPRAELGTRVEEHPKGGFPAFQSDTFAAQLVWLAITFGALYYLMSKVALPQVGAVLEDRRKRIADDLDAAARAKAESDAAVAAYEEAIASARARAGVLAKETQDRLSTESGTERKRLEAELAAKLDTAERTIADSKAQARSNVRAIAADAAAAIVERVTGRSPDAAAVEAALGRANVH